MQYLPTILTHLYTICILGLGTLSPLITSQTDLGLGVSNLYAQTVTIEEFYKLLSIPDSNVQPAGSQGLKKRINSILAKDWELTPAIQSSDPGKNPRARFTDRITTFHTRIPDLQWKPVKIIKAKNQYTVISRVTGTPTQQFFGVKPTGKSFNIQTIHVHTLIRGKIVRSHHVEDWLRAIQQLSSKK